MKFFTEEEVNDIRRNKNWHFAVNLDHCYRTYVDNIDSGKWKLKVYYGAIVLSCVFFLTSLPQAISAPVTIPDASLRAAIETALSKTAGATITDTEMATLTSLDLRKSAVSDLTGLRYATALATLRLDQTPITVAGLSDALSGLSALKRLTLKLTDITDLSVLNSLPSGAQLANLDIRQIGYPDGYWSLKDLTPLATFVEAGRIGADPISALSPYLQLYWNFALDYDSIYTDLPRIIAVIGIGAVNVTGVSYDTYQPILERAFPKTENYAGHPRTRHIFIVRAVNSIVYVGGQANPPILNYRFEGVPVTFTVTAPDGSVTTTAAKTGTNNGLASVIITLGNDGETHSVEAVVPANKPASGPQHDELRVRFTATADSTVPPPDGQTVPADEVLADEVLDVRKPRQIRNVSCGLGWPPQSQYTHFGELPKVMIYALEFEYNPARNAGYTCTAIEIRTGDDSIENLAGWNLYLGTLYNPSSVPVTIPEAHSQVSDRILRITPEMLGLETFPCNTVGGISRPLPGVQYVLRTDENVLVDTAYSCFIWGQNAWTTVNGVNVKSPRRVSSAALREMETPRLERFITNPTGIFITYMGIEEFGWDRVVLSDWLLPASEETVIGTPNAPSLRQRNLITTWGALKNSPP